MIEILMEYAKILEIQKPVPQPRRHKCGKCGKVFVCKWCTKVMNTENASYDYGLTHYRCRIPSWPTSKVLDNGFICTNCR